ncbi:MAG: hypothetical protein ACIAXF_00725 [Phycisphaerales bacterium JB063]
MNLFLAQATPDTANAAASTATEQAGTINIWFEAHRLFETGVDIFSRGDTLAKPDELVAHLSQLGTIWAIVFMVVGMVCLLNGYKFYKIATVALIVALGSGLGYWFGLAIQAPPFIVAACLGLLLAVMAFPLMKFAVAVLGGLSGAFMGANLWAGICRTFDAAYQTRLDAYEAAGATGPNPAESLLGKIAINTPADMYWIGALVGLLACGILAFALFKISIHMFTSVSGATIAVFGVIALLLSIDSFRVTVTDGLSGSALIIPLLVFVPAAIGFVMQEMASGNFGGKSVAAA